MHPALEALSENLVTLPSLAWLGRQQGWANYSAVTDRPDGLPATSFHLNMKVLESLSKEELERHKVVIGTIRSMYRDGKLMAMCVLDLFSKMVADGPKQFVPTEEQWEAMEHVTLDVPIPDFTSPYPVLDVVIPLGARARLAKQFGVPIADAPLSVTVYVRESNGKKVIVTYSGRPEIGKEVTYIFQDQPLNPTVEAALSRNADATHRQTVDGANLPQYMELFHFGHISCRAAMNLCLLLTHYGHTCTPPAPGKNRAEKRHQRFADYASVRMKQDVVVRGPSQGPKEPSTSEEAKTGREVTPHWRRGTWRAYPGQAAKRAAGEKVPLLFVRPCLVRPDRVVGDVCHSQAVYHVRGTEGVK